MQTYQCKVEGRRRERFRRRVSNNNQMSATITALSSTSRCNRVFKTFVPSPWYLLSFQKTYLTKHKVYMQINILVQDARETTLVLLEARSSHIDPMLVVHHLEHAPLPPMDAIRRLTMSMQKMKMIFEITLKSSPSGL